LQRRLRQGQTQECRIRLAAIGEELQYFGGASAVEKEVGIGNQKKIVFRREREGLAIVRFCLRPVA